MFGLWRATNTYLLNAESPTLRLNSVLLCLYKVRSACERPKDRQASGDMIGCARRRMRAELAGHGLPEDLGCLIHWALSLIIPKQCTRL